MKPFVRLAAFLILAVLCAPPSGFAADPPKAEPDAPAAAPKTADPANVAPDAAPGRIIKEPASFHGIKWGTRLEDVKDMRVVGDHGKTRYATVPETTYRIGDVFIPEVIYAFCDEGFAAVRLEFPGKDNFEKVRRVIADKYTDPVAVPGEEGKFALPLGNVLILLEYDPAKDAGALGYSYRPIFEKCAGAPVRKSK